MKTLERQLEVLGESLDIRYGSIEAEEIPHPDRGSHQPSPGKTLAYRPHGANIAISAAAIILLIGGLISYLVPRSEPTESPTANTPPVTESSSTTVNESETPPLIVGSTYVGAETSLGTLTWTRIQGGANSCPPTVRVDEVRGGYYSTWCKGGALHSSDGYTWTEIADFPEYNDANSELHLPPKLGAEPPTVPVGLQVETVFFSETNFGWVASERRGSEDSPRMWISEDGYEWEEVESPPNPIRGLRGIWANAGGGAGDLLYFGYVTTDYQNGNYLWIGHFSAR